MAVPNFVVSSDCPASLGASPSVNATVPFTSVEQTQKFTVENDGGAAIDLSNLFIGYFNSNNGYGWGTSLNTCSGVTLNPGQICTFDVSTDSSVVPGSTSLEFFGTGFIIRWTLTYS